MKLDNKAPKSKDKPHGFKYSFAYIVNNESGSKLALQSSHLFSKI